MTSEPGFVDIGGAVVLDAVGRGVPGVGDAVRWLEVVETRQKWGHTEIGSVRRSNLFKLVLLLVLLFGPFRILILPLPRRLLDDAERRIQPRRPFEPAAQGGERLLSLGHPLREVRVQGLDGGQLRGDRRCVCARRRRVEEGKVDVFVGLSDDACGFLQRPVLARQRVIRHVRYLIPDQRLEFIRKRGIPFPARIAIPFSGDRS